MSANEPVPTVSDQQTSAANEKNESNVEAGVSANDENNQMTIKLFNSLSIKQQVRTINKIQEPQFISNLLFQLLSSTNTDNHLLAYQFAFALSESKTQNFLSNVISNLRETQNNEKVVQILTRKFQLGFHLTFLFKNSDFDFNILVALKEDFNAGTMHYLSFILFYDYMFAGTGDDNLYRNNLNWFGYGRDWSQFLCIASITSNHKGHLQHILQVVSPFLSPAAPPYALGGCLLGLGIVCANYSYDESILQTILNFVEKSSYIVRYGACLSLGLICLGTQKIEYFDLMCNILNDSDVEVLIASSYAAGMIMLGSGECEQFYKLLEYARSKCNRGMPMAIAFMMYGKEEKCEKIVSELMSSENPLLRESAAWTTALAYVGTASDVAFERLLHLAKNDTNNEVRRAASIGIGFVFSKSPKEVPSRVNSLAKSDIPCVQIGAAFAIGISCAGTGNDEAISMLKPLLNDPDVSVIKNAMISMAMVLQQVDESSVPYATKFRNYLKKLINKNADGDLMFGICLAFGILNAEGGNAVISCNTLSGENSIVAAAALALFSNYYSSLNLALMLPIAFHATVVVGLDEDLNIPDWKLLCNGNIFVNPSKVTLAQLNSLSEAAYPEYKPIADDVCLDFVMLKNLIRNKFASV